MINKAYDCNLFCSPDIAPVSHLQHNQYMQELYHGPTASFKDLALQLMPQIFREAANERSSESSYVIVVATSGDTGGASLDGFSRHTNIPIIIFYPNEGVSHLQKLQMVTSEGQKTQVVGVEGDFDYCQTALKRILSSRNQINYYQRTYGVTLSSANSINWARLLPQITYHANGYLELVRKGVVNIGDPVDVCIPTGNFGNILAAFYTKLMGIPFGRFIIASNRNNVLTEFFSSGLYGLRNRQLLQTISPAIDILKSSNLERLLYHITNSNSNEVKSYFNSLDQDGYFSVDHGVLDELQNNFLAGWCSEEDTFRTIHDVFNRYGILIDPHTAVAKYVADNIGINTDTPLLISATAHPSKFAEGVMKAIRPSESFKDKNILLVMESVCGQQARHKQIWGLLEKRQRHAMLCQATKDAIADQIRSFMNKTM